MDNEVLLAGSEVWAHEKVEMPGQKLFLPARCAAVSSELSLCHSRCLSQRPAWVMHSNLTSTPHFHGRLLNSSLQPSRKKKSFTKPFLQCFRARGGNRGAAVDEAVNNAWADCPFSCAECVEKVSLGMQGGLPRCWQHLLNEPLLV